jgi:hypothetical protein
MRINRSPDEGIRITREQRDAIYADVLTHLSAIGDVHLMIEHGKYEEAHRFRREFEEDLRLLDDLGWREEALAEAFELTMPADQLARAMQRFHDRASEALRAHTTRDTSEEEIAARHAITCSACGLVLSRIAALATTGQKEDR